MTQDQQIEQLQAKFGDTVTKAEKDRVGCPVIWIKRDRSVEVLRHLRDTEGFEYRFLSDLTCYDDAEGPDESYGRFVVVYNLFSPQNKNRFRVKARVADGEAVPTIVSLWDAANWAEREVFDMFGVKFSGHPDLRRILMDIRWEGHPLRKDYHWRKYQLFNDPEPMPEHLLREE